MSAPQGFSAENVWGVPNTSPAPVSDDPAAPAPSRNSYCRRHYNITDACGCDLCSFSPSGQFCTNLSSPSPILPLPPKAPHPALSPSRPAPSNPIALYPARHTRTNPTRRHGPFTHLRLRNHNPCHSLLTLPHLLLSRIPRHAFPPLLRRPPALVAALGGDVFTLTLDEDDTHAMIIILQVLHRHPDAPKAVSYQDTRNCRPH